MQRLIPTIYFYVVSLIGLILLIIGVFADVHYLVNASSGPLYPLPYGTEARCSIPLAPGEKQTTSSQQIYNDCKQQLEEERRLTKRNDLEKAVSYTLIGLIVFGIHFYYARKSR